MCCTFKNFFSAIFRLKFVSIPILSVMLLVHTLIVFISFFDKIFYSTIPYFMNILLRNNIFWTIALTPIN